MRAPLWGLSLIAACSSAASPATQVVVSIDSDLAPGTRLAKVTVDLLREDGATAARTMPDLFLRADGEPPRSNTFDLPLSFAILPGSVQTFMLRVRGYGSRTPDSSALDLLVEQRISARFSREKTSLLRVFLGEICVDRCLGGGAQVCYPTDAAGVSAGDCGPLAPLSAALTVDDVAPSELPALANVPGVTRNVPDGGSQVADDAATDDGPAQEDGSVADSGAPLLDPAGDAATDGGAPIDLCAGSSCSTAYPCTPVAPVGYTCLGQLAEWPMPSKVGHAAFRPSYDVSVPGIVRDQSTGLIWQRDLPALYSGCTKTQASTPGEACSQSEALAYCEALELGGYDDWRLPSVVELLSIVDDSVSVPAIDAAAFPGTLATLYWATGPFNESAQARLGWVVNFETGNIGPHLVDNADRVRCVRNGPLRTEATRYGPSSRYKVDAQTDSVADGRTMLTWQRTVPSQSMSWAEAQAYCTSLGNQFRLPTMKELGTLIDPTRATPAIDPVFVGTPASVFWSESPFAYRAGQAWGISFDRGISRGDYPVDAQNSVRCVR